MLECSKPAPPVAHWLLTHPGVYRKLKPRILTVDDDPAVGALLTRLFESTGRYIVAVENEPFRAVAAARKFRPDILLIDVNMPGKTGLELAEQLRSEPWLRYRPIIIFSGLLVPPGLLAAAMGDGPTEFLQKGVPLDKIVETVERLLPTTCQAADA